MVASNLPEVKVCGGQYQGGAIHWPLIEKGHTNDQHKQIMMFNMT